MRCGAKFVVTTDKDYVRLRPETRWPLDMIVMGVEIEFMDDDVSRWRYYISERIEHLVLQRRAG